MIASYQELNIVGNSLSDGPEQILSTSYLDAELDKK